MRLRFVRPTAQDAVTLLALAALLVFAPPLLYWWARPGSPWYFPFLLWGAVVALTRLIQHYVRQRNV